VPLAVVAVTGTVVVGTEIIVARVVVVGLAKTKESHRRIKVAVKASETSVTNIYGVGPILAAGLIGYSGGNSPLRQPRCLCLLQRDGSDRTVLRRESLVHMAAITQIRNPGTPGRIYFERKRQVSNAVYRQLLLDARYGVREDTQG
jgi:transposase